MPVSKITKAAVDKMQPNTVLWDQQVVGFGIRRHAGERRHYLLRYRFQGRQTFRRIGTHGSPFTPDTARTEALRLLGQIVQGINPSAAQHAPVGATFGAEVDRYLAHRERDARPETLKHLVLHLRKHAGPLHSAGLAEIDRRRIAQLLAGIEANSGSVSRNRVRSSLSAFWSWLIAEGLCEANPVAGTSVAEEGPSRDRVLTDAELAEVWRKGNDAIKLLILTGCRRDEVGKLAWSEVDFDRAMLVLPAQRTKNHQKHELPLSPMALAILRARAHAHIYNVSALTGKNDGLVFGRVSWSHYKEQLDKTLGDNVKAWRIHDIRRTCATGMAELGILPHHIEAVLNHISGSRAGVAGIYNRSKLEAPMRDALDRWSRHVEAITL
jgi:integrase